MAQEKKTTDGKSSLAPFAIIGAIALVTVLGIYFVSQSGDKPEPAKTNSNVNVADTTAKLREAYGKAPQGGVPENMLGSPNAPVVVEEFADFQCPTCGVVHPEVKEVISQYGSRIKFVFRNYPLTQIHRNAYDAAVASEAAGLQGKFFQMQDMIFKNAPTWSNMPSARPTFKSYAEKIGLDATKFENDSLGLSAKSRVDADMARGRALNITQTPTILINGVPVPSNSLKAASMKQLIDAEFERINGPKEKPAETKDSENKDSESK